MHGEFSIFTWQWACASKYALEVTKFYLDFRWYLQRTPHILPPPLFCWEDGVGGNGTSWTASHSLWGNSPSKRKTTPHESSSSALEWWGRRVKLSPRSRGWWKSTAYWHLFWLPWPGGHPQPCLSLLSPRGLLLPCPQPRTPSHPRRAVSRYRSDATAVPTSSSHSPALPAHVPCWARPTQGPMFQPGPASSQSPGRCPMSAAGSAPVLPHLLALVWGVGWALPASPCPDRHPWKSPHCSPDPREPWQRWTPSPHRHAWINLSLILCKINTHSHAGRYYQLTQERKGNILAICFCNLII